VTEKFGVTGGFFEVSHNQATVAGGCGDGGLEIGLSHAPAHPIPGVTNEAPSGAVERHPYCDSNDVVLRVRKRS